MRPANQRFYIHSCIYLQILIISFLATFLGTNSLSVLMCRKAVNQSINQSISKSGKFDLITSILRHLHSLPVRRCVESKVPIPVHRCRHGLATLHLYTSILVVWSQHLPLADTCKLFAGRHSRTTGREHSPFLDPTFGTVSQPNCEQSRVLLFLAGN